jgi:predicted  nucleic acid-binding Zn-ribbon protein
LYKYLHLLVDLQNLDTQILALRHKIDTAPVHTAADESAFRQAKKAFDVKAQLLLALEKKKKDKEREIDEITEKIEKMKARASEIKTNKEYQANIKEIESFESRIRAVEDELLAIMESLDSAQREAEAEKLKFGEARAEAEALGKERASEIEASEQELKTLKAGRKALIDRIDPELYSRYAALMKSARGLAVAEVIKEICQGCHMNIPPQLYVQIKSGEDIFECPQCGRLLYYVRPENEKHPKEGSTETGN